MGLVRVYMVRRLWGCWGRDGGHDGKLEVWTMNGTGRRIGDWRGGTKIEAEGLGWVFIIPVDEIDYYLAEVPHGSI